MRVTSDLRWVDDTNHTTLAMLCLGAVEPDWLRSILDSVHESGVRRFLRARDETGPETVVHGLARGGEGSLCNTVVLWPELEGDCVAFGRLDRVRLEDIRAVTDNDEMVGSHGGANKGGSSSSDG